MLKINGKEAVAAYYREHHGMFVIRDTRDSLEIDDGDAELRPAMSDLHRAWRKKVTAHASDPINFRGPHCGVHVRRWRNVHEPSGWSPIGISIECDPGYCGLGAAMEPDEARRIGEALIRAANAAEMEEDLLSMED